MNEQYMKLTGRGKALIAISALLIGLGLISPYDTSYQYFLTLGLSIIALFIPLRYQLALRVAALDKLSVSRTFEGNRVEGQELKVIINIENESMTSIGHMEIYDTPPQLFKLYIQPSYIVSLPARARLEVTYNVKPVVGRHIFGCLRVILRDSLGLFYYEGRIECKEDIIKIKPKIVHEVKGVLSKTVSAPYGRARFRMKGIGMDFLDLRDYQPGDDVRHVHWKATARSGTLKVKEYELEAHLRVIFVLDSTKTMFHGVIGNTKLEYSVRAIAYTSNELLRRGDYVGLVVYNGGSGKGNIMVPLRRSRSHINEVLEALSNVGPIDSSKRMLGNALLSYIIKCKRKKSNLVILVSDLEFTDDSEVKDLLEALIKVREYGNKVVIISPYTPLFEVETLSGIGKVMYRLYAARSWKSREELVKLFEKHGIMVFNVGQKDIIEYILNSVEEVRRYASS